MEKHKQTYTRNLKNTKNKKRKKKRKNILEL